MKEQEFLESVNYDINEHKQQMTVYFGNSILAIKLINVLNNKLDTDIIKKLELKNRNIGM